jgi:hypothetical protein
MVASWPIFKLDDACACMARAETKAGDGRIWSIEGKGSLSGQYMKMGFSSSLDIFRKRRLLVGHSRGDVTCIEGTLFKGIKSDWSLGITTDVA